MNFVWISIEFQLSRLCTRSHSPHTYTQTHSLSLFLLPLSLSTRTMIVNFIFLPLIWKTKTKCADQRSVWTVWTKKPKIVAPKMRTESSCSRSSYVSCPARPRSGRRSTCRCERVWMAPSHTIVVIDYADFSCDSFSLRYFGFLPGRRPWWRPMINERLFGPRRHHQHTALSAAFKETTTWILWFPCDSLINQPNVWKMSLGCPPAVRPQQALFC